MFTPEEKQTIKTICRIFKAQYILIDGVRYACPPQTKESSLRKNDG